MAGLSSTIPSGLPIANLVNINQPGSTTGSSGSSLSSSQDNTNAIMQQLGPTAFLTLLTTQLSNQDPLQPMDDTQSVSQLAQFSALQASTNLEQDFANFQSNFAVLQSSGLLGKTVTVTSANATSSSGSSSVTGTVSSIQVSNGTPSFTLTDSNGNPITDSKGNPVEFTTSQITGISN